MKKIIEKLVTVNKSPRGKYGIIKIESKKLEPFIKEQVKVKVSQ